MTLDISGDWDVVDNLVTVSYQSKTAEGTWAGGVSIPDVLKRVTRKTVNGMLNVQVVTFHLWADLLGAVVPKVNDKLTSGGKVWVVKEVNMESLDTRYKLTCQGSQ